MKWRGEVLGGRGDKKDWVYREEKTKGGGEENR